VSVNLQVGRGMVTWTLNKSGLCIVKSLYRVLVYNGIKVTQKIWRTKIPLKSKVFFWFLKKRVIRSLLKIASLEETGVVATFVVSAAN